MFNICAVIPSCLAVMQSLLAFLPFYNSYTWKFVGKTIVLAAADVWCLSHNPTNGHADVVTHVEVLVTKRYYY